MNQVEVRFTADGCSRMGNPFEMALNFEPQLPINLFKIWKSRFIKTLRSKAPGSSGTMRYV
jgi:hypothetical protein